MVEFFNAIWFEVGVEKGEHAEVPIVCWYKKMIQFSLKEQRKGRESFFFADTVQPQWSTKDFIQKENVDEN